MQIHETIRGHPEDKKEGSHIPEGPELRHSRDALNKIIKDTWITSFALGVGSRFDKKEPDGYRSFSYCLPTRVNSVETKGKFMWWDLTDRRGDSWYMWCTYGMSGQWTRKKTKHSAASVFFVDSNNVRHEIHFNDPRHFGTLKFTKNSKDHTDKLSTLGPCILTSQLTPELFSEMVLRKPSRTIAEALMDQTTVSGCGNYIKAECLFRSGVSPWRTVTEITSKEYVKLCEDLLTVAAESYASQGASISTYHTVDGTKGTTQFDFRVYSRKKCPSGHDVSREETPEGRTSWWCKICQK